MSREIKINYKPRISPIKNIPTDYFPTNKGFWFELSEGLDSGKRMFYRDSIYGSGNPESTIVFVHGNPESSYTYRKVIKHLTRSATRPFRLVAMDHVGFGLSDQASFQMVCMDHAKNLLHLIRYLDLKNVTLIIHDWGGPIGIGAFLQEPERVSNLIILNSTVFPITKTGITYNNYPIPWLGWSKTPLIIPNRFWGSFAAYAICLVKPAGPMNLLLPMLRYFMMAELNSFPRGDITAQKLFKDQFRSTQNILSSKRLVLQTLQWGHGNVYEEPKLGKRDTTTFYRFIQKNINTLWGPNGQNIGVRALVGRWDPLGQNHVLKQWISHLPQLKGHVQAIDGVGHFIEEHRPEEIVRAILEVANLN